MRRSLASVALLAAIVGCTGKTDAPPEQPAEQLDAQAHKQAASAFLTEVNATYQQHVRDLSEAEWAANTRIVEGDDTLVEKQKAVAKAMSDWLGSEAVLGRALELMEHEDALDDLQKRQLKVLIHEAAPNAAAHAELVQKRIAAEAEQTQKLYGYTFKAMGQERTPNWIDEKLVTLGDAAKRRQVWEASKEVGPTLRPGLITLRELRNETVRKAGYDDFYSYQVSDYGMSADEMDELLFQLLQEIWPLYRELHTWARYELFDRYGAQEGMKEPPALIPAHWLPNRWGQSWSALVEVEGLDLNGALAEKTPEWIVREGEAFYVSLGFHPLPESFYEKSSLYPVPEDADYKKNTHASAWHIDLDQDVRSLMSVESNADWYGTVNHELGHIYYYQAYSRPEVPMLLRRGANRAFHEAVGTQMGMAASHRPFLIERGLVSADTEVDETKLLLQEALDLVVFMPFSVGTMTRFERDLYRGELPSEQWNQRWWTLAGHYQGIAPPTPRDEAFCDAATKTHINDDAGQYYDYSLSTVLLFQLHEHIATNILKQDPRATNYWGSTETGTFLKSVLEPGGTRDWRELLKETTGADMSARPMLRYFEPLMAWLKKENEGRVYTLPEKLERPPGF